MFCEAAKPGAATSDRVRTSLLESINTILAHLRLHAMGFLGRLSTLKVFKVVLKPSERSDILKPGAVGTN
jgi:hypothetical protein